MSKNKEFLNNKESVEQTFITGYEPLLNQCTDHLVQHGEVFQSTICDPG